MVAVCDQVITVALMKKLANTGLAICVILLGCCVANNALAPIKPAYAAADHYTVPLVVIRFNQPRVYYERPLYNALKRALQVKPSLRINVINYFPSKHPELVDEAERNLKAVVRSLGEMGIPLSRIGVASEPAPDLDYSEVHIYVR